MFGKVTKISKNTFCVIIRSYLESPITQEQFGIFISTPVHFKQFKQIMLMFGKRTKMSNDAAINYTKMSLMSTELIMLLISEAENIQPSRYLFHFQTLELLHKNLQSCTNTGNQLLASF